MLKRTADDNAPDVKRTCAATPSVAIVGFSGRSGVPSTDLLTKSLFDAMVASAKLIIKESFGHSLDSVCLVSGGAAWADHVAVSLALSVDGNARHLRLYMPGLFDAQTGLIVNSACAHTANTLHQRFAEQTSIPSLANLTEAHLYGADIRSGCHGFLARNRQIAADADYMIAFSWSDTPEPTDGGTGHVWRAAKQRIDLARMVHVRMNKLISQQTDSSSETHLMTNNNCVQNSHKNQKADHLEH